MDFYTEAAGSPTPPATPAPPANKYFTAGAVGSIPAAVPGPWSFHMIMAELVKVIVDSGQTPDYTNLAQLSEAVQSFSGKVGVAGQASGLKIATIGISNYNCVITANSVILQNSAGICTVAQAVNKTINANSTAGGPLAPSTMLAGSTWYATWLWYNAANGLTATLDTSFSAPTAPTGYVSGDYKARIGAVRTDGSGNKYLLQTLQLGRRARYVPLASSNVAGLLALASGVQGTFNSSTFTPTAIAVGGFVPSSAESIALTAYSTANVNNQGIAPNVNFGGWTSANCPPVCSSGNSIPMNAISDMILESSNIYRASDGSNTFVNCVGWTDGI